MTCGQLEVAKSQEHDDATCACSVRTAAAEAKRQLKVRTIWEGLQFWTSGDLPGCRLPLGKAASVPREIPGLFAKANDLLVLARSTVCGSQGASHDLASAGWKFRERLPFALGLRAEGFGDQRIASCTRSAALRLSLN